MSWPMSQDYNEAVQTPNRNFADPELRGGRVVTNDLGLPMPCSGNFADVYRVNGRGGAAWAVKCFTRQVAGLRERYAAVSDHLRQSRLSFTVDFRYLEEGIRVRGQWYPVVKMRWVEGILLNDFVRDNVDKPHVLEALAQIWLRVAVRLREAGVAHGDLQHGNVLLVPRSRRDALKIRLIDYDGMYVPALAARPSGEAGHPNYQHPLRLREGSYGPEVDRFGLLVVATALRCLRDGGRSLWERYDNGDNLLFTQADFADPHHSALFAEILLLPAAKARSMAVQLMAACQKSLGQTPQLEDVFRGPVARPAAPTMVRIPVMHQGAALPLVQPSRETFPIAPAADVRTDKKLSPGQRKVPVLALVGSLALGALSGGLVVLLTKPSETPKHSPAADAAVNHERPLPLDCTGPAGVQAPEVRRAQEAWAKYLGREVEETIEIAGGVRMTFVLIPPGKFRMGSPPTEEGRNDDETLHEVTLTEPFDMAQTEMTQDQYVALMGENPSSFKEPDRPVEQVSWIQAHDCAARLTTKLEDGRLYRLPTEAEWEYSCRAGGTSSRPFGINDGRSLSSWQANFNGNFPYGAAAQGKYLNSTCRVGHYFANALGLYDMHGNVWEWCADGYAPYPAEDVTNPTGPADAGSDRVFRGGSWNYGGAFCRASNRFWYAPSLRRNFLGFRIAAVPSGSR
jgi:formylglycine-generating enzyme required for sulfatase activity